MTCIGIGEPDKLRGEEAGLSGRGDEEVEGGFDEDDVDDASELGKDARVQYEPSDSPSLQKNYLQYTIIQNDLMCLYKKSTVKAQLK